MNLYSSHQTIFPIGTLIVLSARWSWVKSGSSHSLLHNLTLVFHRQVFSSLHGHLCLSYWGFKEIVHPKLMLFQTCMAFFLLQNTNEDTVYWRARDISQHILHNIIFGWTIPWLNSRGGSVFLLDFFKWTILHHFNLL